MTKQHPLKQAMNFGPAAEFVRRAQQRTDEAHGMRASIAAEYDVNRFLAQINSRSTAHRKSTSHREAVVVLEAA